MSLDSEFLKHLQGLMTEVAIGLSESEAKYKAELLFKARQTHNSAATPIAYKGAAIHALTSRFEQTVERYLQALIAFGIVVDDNVERMMLQEISKLGSGPSTLQFPPGIPQGTVGGVQRAYAMERARVVNQLNRAAANRLKELKMRLKQAVPTHQQRSTTTSMRP